jgi:hypothetical protein
LQGGRVNTRHYWSGPDAGQPGTRFNVGMRDGAEGWELHGLDLVKKQKAALWERYTRKQIAVQFDLEFKQGIWGMSGHIIQDNHMFLLVNRDKAAAVDEHKHEAYFIDRNTFHWQSQNSTSPASNRGQMIKNHKEIGMAVHLFVRERQKERGKTMPFYYCGDLDYMEWAGGEKKGEPISVTWRMHDELSELLFNLFEDK